MALARGDAAVIAYFILGLALLAGFILLGRWFVDADPKVVARTLRWSLAGLGLVLVLVVLFAGRQALIALLPMLIFLLLRSRALRQRIKAAVGPTPGQASEIATRFLKMTLDHDSGVMSGEVIEGRFAGRRLDELGLEELVELWRECQAADRQSAAVLEAYLDRSQGEAWRVAAGAAPGGGTGKGAGAGGDGGAMSLEEAYSILGLEAGASKDEVREAHRRLMQKVHPDHGGSNYLAAKINQAKDLLLGG
jgi:hypothetical protein